ncbi:MAG: universal stress protein [Phenylobacterium sp.]|uniref:universal stress protein n=1 Tax=Phenylobacterium sp. TaxID=1871053 RepID=UPI002727BD58|nr:universal stress protein [Phenylobacterium sp.]MDO8912616.1 universal stress protein [Phenylobacterium sp.]MDP3101673.1 universal stress protein [Phenylobacterium sp.]MDP3868011.1 universal stress protein [Phenylobacterium sp.]
MYSHVLISTDGSEVAQKGVEHGLSLAKALGAKVTLITVTERFPVYARGVGLEYAMSQPMTAEYATGQKEAANAALAAAKQLADRLGISTEDLHVPDAHPADAIIEAARSRNCSLIVMASHGRRGLGRLLLGSTTSEVLAASPVPVLVVR